MTQFDMVTTQWAFVGPAIILPEKLGFGIPSGCSFVPSFVNEEDKMSHIYEPV